MRKLAHLGIALFTFLLFFQSCGTPRSAAEKEQQAAEIANAVNASDFIFKATYAHPTGFRSRHLSPYYEVDVSSDTVDVYLPYFGRAYKAPMNPNEGGYRFTSVDFDYSVEPGSKSGNWYVEIKFNDLDRSVSFNFDIWENETARLSIIDTDRQGISFQGDIVTTKNE
ncbi:MAG: DUF4251 domain-containing protein [Fermentimonas sp.]|nr:DUF4251 domain-containing protein [Fermentimonas sp.]